MINTNQTYTYRDLSILPAIVSSISSRKECNPYYDKMLPIFTAPMDSIVNEQNINEWIDNSITPIVPRNIEFQKRLDYTYKGYWVAYSLSEFINVFCQDKAYFTEENNLYIPEVKVVIDIANGHMQKIFDVCKKAKEVAKENNYHLVIMAGNIACPETYLKYCEVGIDYVRCGIGGGSMCTTTTNTGIHCPMASLINDVSRYKIWRKLDGKFYTKVIADGSIKGYSDVIKALALGADYVMVGGQFSKLLESAAEFINADSKDDKLYWSVWDFDKSKKCKKDNDRAFTLKMDKPYDMTLLRDTCRKYHVKLYKSSHGMSTQEAQKRINKNAPLKVSEGKTIIQESNMTISEWVTEFIAALTSAMSYCDCRTLEHFIGGQELVVNSYGVLNTVNATNQ